MKTMNDRKMIDLINKTNMDLNGKAYCEEQIETYGYENIAILADQLRSELDYEWEMFNDLVNEKMHVVGQDMHGGYEGVKAYEVLDTYEHFKDLVSDINELSQKTRYPLSVEDWFDSIAEQSFEEMEGYIEDSIFEDIPEHYGFDYGEFSFDRSSWLHVFGKKSDMLELEDLQTNIENYEDMIYYLEDIKEGE